MLQRLQRSDPILGVDHQHLLKQIKRGLVQVILIGFGDKQLEPGPDIPEVTLLPGILQGHRIIRQEFEESLKPEHLDHDIQQILVITEIKQREFAENKTPQDETQIPNIHAEVIVRVSHQNLRRFEKFGADFGASRDASQIHLSAVEIDYLHFLGLPVEEDVVGLDVSVDDALQVHFAESGQSAAHVVLDLGERQVVEVAFEGVVGVELHDLRLEVGKRRVLISYGGLWAIGSVLFGKRAKFQSRGDL